MLKSVLLNTTSENLKAATGRQMGLVRSQQLDMVSLQVFSVWHWYENMTKYAN